MFFKRHATKFIFATALLGTWASGLVYAGHQMVKEATEPGAVGRVPLLWPVTSQLAHRRSDQPTLVLALHPRCSCSAATVVELRRLLEKFPERINVQVLVRQPENEIWPRSSREEALSVLPGVTLIMDHGGAEAERFGALTSGQVVLFDKKGIEVFAGGLTATRGHEGPSAGSATIAAYLEWGRSIFASTPVFGCSLSGARL